MRLSIGNQFPQTALEPSRGFRIGSRRLAIYHPRPAPAGDLQPSLGGKNAVRLGDGVEVNAQIRAQTADGRQLRPRRQVSVDQKEA